MQVDRFEDRELENLSREIENIGNKSIQQVIKDNKENDIPIVYSVNNKIFYELPDGTITTESPF